MTNLVLSDVRYNDLDETAEGVELNGGFDVTVGLPIYQVINGDELRTELIHRKKIPEVRFWLCKATSYWDWEMDYDSVDGVNKDAFTCTHEWVNVGFNTVRMACKHCNRDAPDYVQKRYEP